MRYLLITIILLFQFISSNAQEILPTPRNIQVSYDKGTRSISGQPGSKYWQNSADYKLDIHFYPATRLLTGTVMIDYVNNSPDTLKQVWFKLTPNYYKKGAPRDRGIDPADEGEGVQIDLFKVKDSIVNPGKLNIRFTSMDMKIPALLPGAHMQFTIGYHYTLNKGSHNRMGEIDPGADFIAYFFPRIAVYDDRDGWDKSPYLGSLEFYNDFCHFDANITVPANTLVWATGELRNPREVLNPVFAERLAKAEREDAIIDIIDTADIKRGNITAQGKPFNTWHFEASNVPDMAFAVSDHYVWQSSSVIVDPTTKRRTRVDAVFNPKHTDYYLVASDARKTVEAMSYTFPAWPYPYPHETVFDGLDQMEYPMMVNDNPVEDRAESIELTDHEIFHTMFPFYMGINETKYAWMDEGWATIGEWIISPLIDSSLVDEYGIAPTGNSGGTEIDIPIVTPSTELNYSYFINSYPKPALGYLYIKDYLGDELFKKALHHYIRTWNGKHPMPNDFFYCMNAGAGKNLNWFWKRWFFDNGSPDLAITNATAKSGKLTVMVENKGGRPLPIDLTINYADGTKERLHRTIAVWEKGEKTTTLTLSTSKKIAKLVLEEPHTPDSNQKDNVFEMK